MVNRLPSIKTLHKNDKKPINNIPQIMKLLSQNEIETMLPALEELYGDDFEDDPAAIYLIINRILSNLSYDNWESELNIILSALVKVSSSNTDKQWFDFNLTRLFNLIHNKNKNISEPQIRKAYNEIIKNLKINKNIELLSKIPLTIGGKYKRDQKQSRSKKKSRSKKQSQSKRKRKNKSRRH